MTQIAELIVTFSVLVLAVAAIRLAAGDRIHPRLQYALWGILPLRALVYLFQALFLSLPQTTFNAVYVARGVAQRVAGSGLIQEQGTMGAGLAEKSGEGAQSAMQGAGGILAGAMNQEAVLIWLWAAGAAALAVWLVAAELHYVRRLRASGRFLSSEEAAAITGLRWPRRLRIWVTEAAKSPCLTGILFGAVYLPKSVADQKHMLRYALLHEYCHYKQGDLIWSRLRELLLAAFWFHPLMWLGAVLSKKDCELSCDAAVLEKLEKTERLAYGSALLNLIPSGTHRQEPLYGVTTMSGSSKNLKRRILRIASNRKMASAALAAVIAAVTFTSALTFTEAAAGPLMPVSRQRQEQLLEFGSSWAAAYCGRDAMTLYHLSKDADVFLQAGGYFLEGDEPSDKLMPITEQEPAQRDVEARKEENIRLTPLIGMSSPWPWFYEDCRMEVTGRDQLTIYYVARTSDPSGWVWVQQVKTGEQAGKLTALQVSATMLEEISSKADFERVYPMGFHYLDGFGETYQSQADNPQQPLTAQVLRDPLQAVVMQLHLKGAAPVLVPGSQKSSGRVQVELRWSDGTVRVQMAQPEVLGEKGIWIAVNEGYLNKQERAPIVALGERWAQAFCGRDGEALLGLCTSQGAAEQMGVTVLSDGTGTPKAMVGMSSPWPWNSEECVIELSETGKELQIYTWYHAGQSSSLSIWRLGVRQESDGAYRIDSAELEDLGVIDCAMDFSRAFRYGFGPSASMGEAYQSFVDNTPNEVAEGIHRGLTNEQVYCNPLNAAMQQLNLEGGRAMLAEQYEEEGLNRANVWVQWPDGRQLVRMVQPRLQGAAGVWVPDNQKTGNEME